MRNTIWNAARRLTLGLAVVAGFLTVGAVSAKAAPVQFQVSFGDRYSSPGEGYVWVEGYYNGGYWVPGEWAFRGYGPGYGYRTGYGYRGDFRYDHERRFEGYRDRGWDRDRDRDRGGDHNWNRGGDRHFENDRHFDGGRGNDRGRGNDHGFGGDHHNRR